METIRKQYIKVHKLDMNYRIYDIAFSVSSAIGTEALGSCWLRRNDATCTCWCSCDVCLPLDLQRGIRGMPSCLYFSVDIEKWGILLEADSSHPLAFDVEKKTHTKTKQNLTHVKCCSWDMKSFSPYIVYVVVQRILQLLKTFLKKNPLLDVSLIFSVMILLFYEY